MKTTTITIALVLFAHTAWAAPADWKSYLCSYGNRSQVIKVNVKDERVKINDRDMGNVKFKPNSVTFTGPRGDWILDRLNAPNPTVVTMDGYLPQQGNCRAVDDD